MAGGYDKVPLKWADWGQTVSPTAGFRAVPGSVVRRSAYIAPGVVLMPSFVNVGAHVGKGTMIDTWATVGSCAQIGANCHISGGAGIGGVLEPLQAEPVIIEDDCFIGARSEVAEGVIVEQGSVLSMGVFLGRSTKIVDRATGEIFYGRVPSYSVVVPGAMPGKPFPDGTPGPSLGCAVIVKRVDARPAPRPRSTRCSGTEMVAPIDPVALAQELIRRPSVTPADCGASDIPGRRPGRAGIRCHRFQSDAYGGPAIDNLYARLGTAAQFLFRRP